ncbi:MAG: hypothetical protein AB7I25_08245 [Vicinamibacterales bacterium]
MRLVLSDLRPLLALLPFALALAAVLAWLQFRSRWPVSRALTRREWALLAKVLAIPVFILLLVTARVILHVPAAQFLYGRF